MKVENRTIDLSVSLPVIECDTCKQKFVLMEVRDCAEFDVDNLTYVQNQTNYCPHCGKKHV